MSIPQLENCCFCFNIKTGSKIIGWLSLISSIFVVISFGVALGGLFYIRDHPEAQGPEAKEIRENFTILVAVLVVFIILYVIGTIIALMLLLGIYQNKPNLIRIWVMINLVVTVLSAFLALIKWGFARDGSIVGEIIGTLFNLYLILVVYSYYRSVENTGGNYA